MTSKGSADDLSPGFRRNPPRLQSNRSLSGDQPMSYLEEKEDDNLGMDRRASPFGHAAPTSILKNSKNSSTNVRDHGKGNQFSAIYDQLVRVKKAQHVAKRLQSENEETI
mmetsp:Transcript_42273/g.55694  ORF Transcript_42273/g.55694 Transcript_42273/m.55694 type:complete len:110 (-) Transcript_42273:12-341(-)